MSAPERRLGGESSWGTEPAGCNEDEPHPMSPDNASPGAGRAAAVSSEGRGLAATQPSAQQDSGGVSVDSMPGRASSEGWGVCGSEATQPFV